MTAKLQRRTTRAPADLEGALDALGVWIRHADDEELHGMCPLHVKRTGREVRHPSWSINRGSGLHNCFSCGYKGSFLGLVMDLRFPHDVFRAQRWIRAYGVDMQAAVDAVPSWQDRREEPELEELDLNLAARLAAFSDPPAEALAARGLTAEAAAHYGVRWDLKNEAWILPIRRADDGAVLGWQVKARDGRFFRNYPLRVPKGQTLFGHDVAPEDAPWVLLESPLDVVRLHTAGFLGGVSSYGVEWTDAQMALIADRTDELITAFDNDTAGWKALAVMLYGDPKAGRRPWTRRLPDLYVLNYAGTKAKDVGDMTDAEVARAIERARHWTELVTAKVR